MLRKPCGVFGGTMSILIWVHLDDRLSGGPASVALEQDEGFRIRIRMHLEFDPPMHPTLPIPTSSSVLRQNRSPRS